MLDVGRDPSFMHAIRGQTAFKLAIAADFGSAGANFVQIDGQVYQAQPKLTVGTQLLFQDPSAAPSPDRLIGATDTVYVLAPITISRPQ